MNEDELYASGGDPGGDEIDDLVPSNTPVIGEEDLFALYAENNESAGDAQADETVKRWEPPLSPKQLEVFYDESANLLVSSMRFTGKSWAVGYAIVKHCYDYPNAHVLLVAKTKRQLMAGGLMSKLVAEILPDFQRNLEGFSFSGIKLTIEKDVVVTLVNRYGGKSIIQMMSVGSDSDLQSKAKGIEASLVVVDEITLYSTPEIYSSLSAMLGRKSSIPAAAQRFIGTTNPDSPTHWVATTWSVLDVAKRDPDFHVIELLPEDNPAEATKTYYARLKKSLQHNPTKYQRDILGLWVDIPSGDALFLDFFIPTVHVIGDLAGGTGLSPVKGYPMTLGLDLGDVNHGVSFSQDIPVKDKNLWLIFDEINSVGKRISLEAVTRRMMVKVNQWGVQLDYDFSFVAVSDNAAFKRYRANTGSMDFAEVEKHWKAMMSQFPRIKYPLRILEAPKGDGSVSVRTRRTQDMLSRSELFVSAQCVAHVAMFNKITGTKKTPMAPDPHDPLKHTYDAATYPIIYYKSGDIEVKPEDPDELKPVVIRAA